MNDYLLFEEYTKLESTMRDLGFIIETKTVGLHTEVRIHNTIRDSSVKMDIKHMNAKGEPVWTVFIRCAREVLDKSK